MTVNGEYAPSAAGWVREQVELYESTGGAEGGTFKGRPIVVVTSLGAKSGKVRKHPAMRVEHEGRYALVAASGGDPQHPSWYFNLVAHPEIQLQDGSVKREYVVRETTGEERALWWERAVAAYPLYTEYAALTDRVLPVLVAEPV